MGKLKEINFLRAFAILSVVIIHLTSNFLFYPKDTLTYFTFGIINKSLLFAVPLFIFISSLVLSYKYKDDESFNILKFYSKQLSKVIIAFIIWSIIYIVYFRYPTFNNISNSFFYYFILANACYHLYFIPIIVQLYLLFPIILFIARKIRKLNINLFFSFLLCCTFCCIFHYLFTGILRMKISPNFLYFYIIIFSYILPVGIGIWFGFNYNNVLKYFTKTSFVILLTLTILFGSVYIKSELFNFNYYVSVLYAPLYWMLAILTLLNLCMFIKNSKILDEISNKSFVIYLCHPLILDLINSYVKFDLFSITSYQIINNLLIFIAKFVLVFGISYLISYVWGLLKKAHTKRVISSK